MSMTLAAGAIPAMTPFIAATYASSRPKSVSRVMAGSAVDARTRPTARLAPHPGQVLLLLVEVDERVAPVSLRVREDEAQVGDQLRHAHGARRGGDRRATPGESLAAAPEDDLALPAVAAAMQVREVDGLDRQLREVALDTALEEHLGDLDPLLHVAGGP